MFFRNSRFVKGREDVFFFFSLRIFLIGKLSNCFFFIRDYFGVERVLFLFFVRFFLRVFIEGSLEVIVRSLVGSTVFNRVRKSFGI